ncbi:SDR family oxidoreductase [Turicibacter bilis]|uniref:SDR family oxidoreductase n=1 Tax=Turicibacter bilis TaxID=2735723 RepID=A0A9Q9FF88_9FIRM|nr:SDR family oxidoreductase [Turicibacter bilis]MBS3198659.1 SDR family oxidoreductase [Turicibacter bilis]UUF08322.1 SDR family oxidoreductase [Turicibacter bilis]
MGYQDVKFPNGTVFLVTGGAGFIGSNLCEAILKMGHKVKCLDDFSTGKEENIKDFIDNKDFQLIRGDIRNIETCMKACEGVDYVLHQAAWGSVPRSIEMPLIYEEVNIKGTLNMMDAARLNNVKRFVYASSSSVYGDHPVLPKVEGQEGNILSPYALTKKVNEEYAKLYYRLYGLETVGMRYFNVFGRRQDPHGYYAAVIPKFVKCLLNNESPVINGDGKQSRDFTYIENVIEANLKACYTKENVGGETFNIACGGQVNLIELYDKICEVLEVRIDPKFGPIRIGDIKHSNASIQKAKQLLDYNPDFNFREGIKLTIKYYKEYFMSNH